MLKTLTIINSIVLPRKGNPNSKAADVIEIPFSVESCQTPVDKMAKPVSNRNN